MDHHGSRCCILIQPNDTRNIHMCHAKYILMLLTLLLLKRFKRGVGANHFENAARFLHHIFKAQQICDIFSFRFSIRFISCKLFTLFFKLLLLNQHKVCDKPIETDAHIVFFNVTDMVYVRPVGLVV